MAEAPLVIAAATRPFPGETANGDGWRVDWHEGSCRIAVIDGLGHGPEAAVAKDRALEALARQPEMEVVAALHLCHRALSGTRGAAISLVKIDPGNRTLRYVGIGNVEGRLRQGGREQRFLTHRGIVGAMMRTVTVIEFALEEEWLVVIHTDGISARFDLEPLIALTDGDIQALADTILLRWSHVADDATTVVARQAA
jgi:serine phosphatase RsbU (regulator of sigma subunit)